jgi:hypothetical protein
VLNPEGILPPEKLLTAKDAKKSLHRDLLRELCDPFASFAVNSFFGAFAEEGKACFSDTVS